jgi:hypothetical protein
MSSTVRVNADRTGTIVQRMVFTRAAVDQLKQLGTMGGNGTKPFDPVSEEQARAEAAKLGNGVTYVSSTPIDDETGLGRETTYAFTDIAELRINQQPQVPGARIQTDSLRAMSQTVAFGLDRLPNGNTLLTITMPQLDLNGRTLGLGGGGSSEPSPEQLAMARQMFAGARVNIGVEPGGALVRTSSPYVAGNRITLLDLDFDRLFDGPGLERIRGVTTADELRAALKDVPGLTINLDPQITIEFKAR